MSKVNELIEHFGGLQRTAEAFGIRAPSVHEWRERDAIPVARCLDAERLTEGKFTRFDLRPDVFGPAPGAKAA